MNILLTVPRMNIGGAETYVHTVAEGLKKRGHHVVVASWGGKLADDLSRKGIPHYRVPIRLHAGLAGFLLKRIIRKEHIHLVHGNSADGGAAAYEACKDWNVPWLMTSHGSFGREKKYQGIPKADRVICVSRSQLEGLTQNTDVPGERGVLVYSGIDCERFRANEERRRTCRAEYGVREDEFLMGIVSRISNLDGKGHEDLFQVMANYPWAQKWRLLIVGKGRPGVMGKLKERAKELGVYSRVIFAGHHTRVEGLMDAMDVMALPSKWETFGLVLIEAMAMGKPVVTYDVAGTSEAVGREGAGFLVKLNDIDELAEKLRLCTDKNQAANMGKAGRERVEEYFCSEKMLDRLVELYEKILREHPPAHVFG